MYACMCVYIYGEAQHIRHFGEMQAIKSANAKFQMHFDFCVVCVCCGRPLRVCYNFLIHRWWLLRSHIPASIQMPGASVLARMFRFTL